MFHAETSAIGPEHEEAVTGLYNTYGNGDSAHAFRTLYIWAKDMGHSLFLTHQLYSVKIADEGDNTWFFPVGEETEKETFIKSLSKKGSLTFRYMTKEDADFLETHFTGKFEITPSPDDSEYIYDRNTLENLPGGSMARKRDYIRSLKREHTFEIQGLTEKTVADARIIIDAWTKNKEDDPNVMDKRAMNTILSWYTALGITGTVIYMDGEPCGIVLGYKLKDDTVDCCLQKTAFYIHGLQYFIRQQFAKIHSPEVLYFNWEEDLGLPGLRTVKQRMHPCAMIDMYTGKLK